MNEIIFAPDSGAPILVKCALVAIALFGLLLGLYFYRRTDKVDWGAVGGLGLFIALGGVLLWMAITSASGVALHQQGIVLRYPWPRSDRSIPYGDIVRARVAFAGTERPSPHFELDLVDGETLTGEGTSDRDAVERAVAGVNDRARR